MSGHEGAGTILTDPAPPLQVDHGPTDVAANLMRCLGTGVTPVSAPGRHRTLLDQVRRQLQDADPNAMTGDPDKIAAIVYQTTRQTDPPLRLTLGGDPYDGDPYDGVHAALTGRLAALEEQRAAAESVSFGS